MTSSYHYVWLIWASSFLIPWSILFLLFRQYREIMIKASICTVPFGLTEPLFVPKYWSPPSLFDLAQTTGFDIESLIFTFGIGGIGAVLYNVITRSQLAAVQKSEKRLHRHRLHRQALLVPVAVFPLLYFLPWNPIYPAFAALAAGAVAAMLCRPDLMGKTWIGGIVFTGYYGLFVVA